MTVLARVLAKGTVLYRYCTGTGTSTRYRYGVTLRSIVHNDRQRTVMQGNEIIISHVCDRHAYACDRDVHAYDRDAHACDRRDAAQACMPLYHKDDILKGPRRPRASFCYHLSISK